ncbi:MAG: cation-translocating P-type ATPase [Bacilli bacterium]
MNKNNNYIGLNDKEVIKSKELYGINELEKKKKENILKKAIHIFTEPMFLLLIIAASIYFILGEISDGIIMLLFVLFISGIEFIQEEKTSRALDELDTLSSLNVKVIRNNEITVINSRDIVVGDIVILEEGDKVPADGIILECQGLGINESTLTGESEVVYKKLKDNNDENNFKLNMCYASTDVASGSAIIKITSVGINTEYGKIGTALSKVKKNKTPLEKQINKLVVICTVISLIFLFLVVVINFINNKDLILKERIINSILSGITVAMATIPEEIPVVLTVFLALGAFKLSKKNTLTRNMKAVETLGAVTVLCTDKTGTLTQNKMTVKDTFSFDKDFFLISSLACSKNPYDPMEIAIQKYCLNQNITKEIYSNKLIHEYIFNNKDKMMGQVWEIDNKNLLCVKGACENVLPLCHIDKDQYLFIKKKINDYSHQGYRVLAVAKKNNIETLPRNLKDIDLEFTGLIALLDPPRKGVKEAIKTCHNAGVRVIMITGDSGETAKGIARQIGLTNSKNIITGIELEKMDDQELKEKVVNTNIFARVYPSHKMRIVKALQENGEVVAMTGDGVNDAIALKKAEIGIAMGKRGTNVAKEASDMILMDDNFTTIVEAIKNGRTIYNNIKKAISYILIIHIPIALSSLFVPLFNLPSLLLPIHIVLLELIIDPTSSIIFERLKPDENVMTKSPRKINESIISSQTLIKCILQGLIIFLVFFGSYYYFIKAGKSISLAMTFSFTTLVLSNIFVVYVLAYDSSAIKNLIISSKDKTIVIINSIIIVALFLVIYVPYLNNIVGTSPLNINYLLLAVLFSSLATFPFDILKKINNH